RITETGTGDLAGALRHRSRSLWRLLDQSGQLRFRKNAARPDRAGHGDVPDHASRCDPRFLPKTSMDIVAGILGPGRDSNPRSAATGRRFSRPPRSTAPAPLPISGGKHLSRAFGRTKLEIGTRL